MKATYNYHYYRVVCNIQPPDMGPPIEYVELKIECFDHIDELGTITGIRWMPKKDETLKDEKLDPEQIEEKKLEKIRYNSYLERLMGGQLIWGDQQIYLPDSDHDMARVTNVTVISRLRLKKTKFG